MYAAQASFYITGGTLPRDAPCYVARSADTRLLEGLRSGQFCYVLTARQMGKSSLMVRAASTLRSEGACVVLIDLSSLGQDVCVEQWCRGLLDRIARQLDLDVELEDFWNAHSHLAAIPRLFKALEQVVLVRCAGPVVVFVDEIDMVRTLPFSTDAFFAAIRACYNRRAENASLERLTFCLLGVAAPSDLIRDPRMTPFNVGQRIQLEDFTAEEAAPLAQGLGENGPLLLRRVLFWTGGHPFLTQRLCQAVADQRKPDGVRGVDALCADLFFSPRAQETDDNLLFVRESLLRSDSDPAALLTLYGRVRSGQTVAHEIFNQRMILLLLCGIVRSAAGRLQVRNRIYARVFNRRWVAAHMPGVELRRQRAAYRRGVARTSAYASVALCVVSLLAVTAANNARVARTAQIRAQRVADHLRTALGERDREAARARAEAKRANRSLALAVANARQAAQNAAQAREQGRQADRERAEAVRQKRVAQAQTLESRERRRRLLIAYGTQLEDEGDLFGALLWFAQAAMLESSDPSRRSIHQIRIGTLLRQLPRLSHLWFDVRSARFSPDGSRVVTTSRDGAARVWDAVSGAQVSPPMKHGDPIDYAVFSPDGRRVLTLGINGARVWDAKSGAPLTGLLTHKHDVMVAVLSPDGRRIVTGDYGGTARLWNVKTGQIIREQSIGSGRVQHVEFSRDGRRAVIASDGGILLWDVQDGDRSPSMRLDGVAIRYATFSPDGQRVAITDKIGAAQVLDATSGQPITPPLAHADVVTHVCFSPDGTRVATSSMDNTAQVWDATTGARVSPPMTHGSAVYSVCFSPDGRRISTVSTLYVYVWDAATGEPIMPPLLCGGLTVAFDPEGRRLLTWNGSIARLWDTAGVGMPDQFPGEYANVACAAFSPDGRRLATGDFDWGARVWETQTGRPTGPLLAHGATVREMTFSPDGKRLATASDDGRARVWDTASGRLLVTLRHRDGVSHVVFSANGRLLATSAGGRAYLWESATGKQVCALRGHAAAINSILFSPNGARLVTASQDYTACVWDTASGKLLHILSHSAGVKSACFSPDGRFVLTASRDTSPRLFDASHGMPIPLSLRHDGQVVYATLSTDGRRVLTINSTGETLNNSGEVRIWDMATREAITPPLRHRGPVVFATFSHAGKFVITCSRDGTARVWEAATGEPITPPLRHRSAVRQALFSPDDRRVLTLCDDGVGRVWTLPQEKRSPAELRMLAELLAAHRLTASGGMVQLEPESIQTLWNALSPKRRAAYGPSHAQLCAWHLAEAAADYGTQAWPRVVRHLDWLLGNDPANRPLRALRAYAHAQLCQWSRVIEDHVRIDNHPARLLLLESHRPIHVVRPGDRPMEIGAEKYLHGLSSMADTSILALLPGPGKRFTATAGVANRDSAASDGTFTHSVLIGGREVFRSSRLLTGHPGQPVAVSLDGATAFMLMTRHSGPDAPGAWAEGRIELKDGRTLLLSELPIQPLGSL